MIKILESFTAAGNAAKPNEDLIYISDSCAAVLDGATNLNGSSYGANEFVRDFSAHFDKYIKALPLWDAINNAIADLHKERFGSSPAPDDLELYSSAAAAFAHVHDGVLDIVTLGDCAALVFTDGGLQRIYNDALDKLDGIVTDRLKTLRRLSGDKADVCELLETDEIRKLLIENRKKMNKPNGYRSLSFGMPKVTRGDATAIDAASVKKVVLYSDGFKPVERDIESETPIAEVYAKLRAQENADAKLNARPRFKISDDASMVSFKID